MSLSHLYNQLYEHYGPQQWWPADTPFEVVIGAILTQNTNWLNVEKAIGNLRQAGALDPDVIRMMPAARLETLIRPSGYFRQKGDRLQRFTRWLHADYHNDLQQLFALPLPELRTVLLRQHGIGPETADSIILYAAGKSSFVVDAYTHRLLERLEQASPVSYATLRTTFMRQLPESVELYQEFHALIVRHAKECCRKRLPLCPECPVLKNCAFGQELTNG